MFSMLLQIIQSIIKEFIRIHAAWCFLINHMRDHMHDVHDLSDLARSSRVVYVVQIVQKVHRRKCLGTAGLQGLR